MWMDCGLFHEQSRPIGRNLDKAHCSSLCQGPCISNSLLTLPSLSPTHSAPPSHELSVLTWPICSLYGWTLRKRARTLWPSFIEENKLITVPVGKYYITHFADSGPKKVYVKNERNKELLLGGLNAPTSKDSHC